MRDLKSEALDHIDRNGKLVLFPAPTPDVIDLFIDLEGQGLIERNPWSDRWQLTDAGKAAAQRVERNADQWK